MKFLKSLATTVQGVFADLFRHSVSELQAADRTPPDAGTNSPLFSQPINNADEFMSAMDGQFSAQRKRQGGSAIDTPWTPADQTYAARRRDFIQAEEGVRLLAYDDKTGRPVPPGEAPQGKVTVGAGFNMDKPAARQEWLGAFGKNGPDFDAVRAGQANLTHEEVYKLFDHTMNAVFEPIVSAKFKDVPMTSRQRLALVSAAYNGPSLLNNLVEPAQRGDWNAVADLLAKGNGNPVLASRRRREADMLRTSRSS